MLEQLLSHLHLGHYGQDLCIRILIPRDLARTHLPADLVGVVDALSQWPDPRAIKSKMHYTAIEADNFLVSVDAIEEQNTSVGPGMSFVIGMQNADIVPPLPLYPVTRHPSSRPQIEEAADFEQPLFAKMRALQAAAAAPPPAGGSSSPALSSVFA
ncbi:hypothetical protein EK21DRAFT_88078 [Setomelanomma holmii]|uniref:Uncharacterized protein n=1 Tax=Setomelanomma holmii TaxID=210430 RepID=A0A9P4HB48_9PLEO|nr:hypothetical protein EK21DRAFT_88078 [Setomelanomma holmii]